MSDNPVFVYGAVYADRAGAEADYDTLLDLHAAELVGSYDVALVYKGDDGKVHVTKHEKPTQHGAWTGAAVGALVGVVFPPAVIGSAVVGAVAGGGIGHALGGMSRNDVKELGEHLDDGQAALIVIGKSRVQEQLDKALTRAEKSDEREIDADAKEPRQGARRAPCLVGLEPPAGCLVPRGASRWVAGERAAGAAGERAAAFRVGRRRPDALARVLGGGAVRRDLRGRAGLRRAGVPGRGEGRHEALVHVLRPTVVRREPLVGGRDGGGRGGRRRAAPLHRPAGQAAGHRQGARGPAG